MSKSISTNRRQFLGTAAATVAGSYAAKISASPQARQPGPNDTINVALIGCGARGADQVMPSFMAQPETDAQIGHDATNLGHLMNVSWEVGRSIGWDGETEEAINDAEANKLVTKPYRTPGN